MPTRLAADARGLCLAPALWRDAMQDPTLDWVQVHPENVMGRPRLEAALDELAAARPVALHATALCFGSPHGLPGRYVRELRALRERIGAVSVSGHLAWSAWCGVQFNELLPLPLNRATLDRVCRCVDGVQAALRGPVLVENPARLQPLRADRYEEAEFLERLVAATGCGLLLDLSNLWVSARNLGQDAVAQLAALPQRAVRELHLGGWRTVAREARGTGGSRAGGDEPLYVDSHDAPVAPQGWQMYRHWCALAGRRPLVLEWDQQLPSYRALRDQLELARPRIAPADPAAPPIRPAELPLRSCA